MTREEEDRRANAISPQPGGIGTRKRDRKKKGKEMKRTSVKREGTEKKRGRTIQTKGEEARKAKEKKKRGGLNEDPTNPNA